MNSQSLSANDIMNEVGNSLKSSLIEATRTTVVNILNGTYPRTSDSSFQNPNEVSKSIATYLPAVEGTEFVGEVMYPDGHFRKLLQAAEQADAAVLEMDLATYHAEMHDDMASILNATRSSRRLHYMRDATSSYDRLRRLVYYSDEFPAQITQIADSTTCPGSAVNDAVRCAVVSSSVCLVLEAGDDPVEIRRTIVDGMEEAFQSGNFVNNIP